MGSAVRKTALREIKGTFGRFFAIMAIIALGVGFFSGVRITTPAMVRTVDSFLSDTKACITLGEAIYPIEDEEEEEDLDDVDNYIF